MQANPEEAKTADVPAASVVDPGSVHRATELLREFLDASALFERSLRTALDVNPTDLDAMEHLLMSGPLSPTELAQRLGISTASTTTAVDRLVKLGHVSRQPNPHDRRGILVVPAEQSRQRAMARLLPMIMSVNAQLDDFSESEQRAITEYLERVVRVYRQHGMST